jgi:hypothetical protein
MNTDIGCLAKVDRVVVAAVFDDIELPVSIQVQTVTAIDPSLRTEISCAMGFNFSLSGYSLQAVENELVINLDLK